MKRPRHGIRSTSRLTAPTAETAPTLDVPAIPPPVGIPVPEDFDPPPLIGPNIIQDDTNESIANVFCYGASADKQSGVVYNDLTGNFLFVSFDGSVCFLVLYH
jgi:hypothetical protein